MFIRTTLWQHRATAELPDEAFELHIRARARASLRARGARERAAGSRRRRQVATDDAPHVAAELRRPDARRQEHIRATPRHVARARERHAHVRP
eukprot:CAMPEP_0185497472 /NCGR_PEP_ID=MMETSP1366-20130426/18993_1 /TAXON_ID=38817 /ORGANISM="Gephyrocapsa oceanica, Strain RCC1303" /LENGTH=93 /DNA_ID=CAMNT_0028106581 /DNA_START=101 /DNA_END=378 /DNA_ORIENTATION=-